MADRRQIAWTGVISVTEARPCRLVEAAHVQATDYGSKPALRYLIWTEPRVTMHAVASSR